MIQSNFLSISDILFKANNIAPNKVAIADTYHELTYNELYLRSLLFAKHLKEIHNVNSGDVIAFLVPNSVEFVVIHFAIQFLGCVSTPLDPDINSKKLSLCVDQGAVNLIIVSNLTSLDKYKSELRSKTHMKIINSKVLEVLLSKTLTKLEKEFCSHFQPLNNINEVALYLFTTGSTGSPKGVVIKQSSAIQALKNILKFIGYSGEDSELISLPLSHSFGLGHLHCNIAATGTSYLIDGITNFKLTFDFLDKKKPTGFPGTPSGFKILTKMFPKRISDCQDFLKFIVINSEKCPPSLIKTITELLPRTKIIIYYGLTEASRSTFIEFNKETQDYYLDSVGKPSPNVDVCIVNDSFSKNENYVNGRVAIKGNHLADCYLGNHNILKMHNEWLITDDVGYMDKDNYLFLTGRVSFFINKAGLKVDPKEIQDLIESLNIVTEVAVIGIDNEISGEIICVCYVLETHLENVEKLISQECASKLEKSKNPDIYFCVDSIPKSKNGKLLLNELKEKITFV